MVVPWWYWGCVNLYSPPTTTTIRTTFHHPIHSYWGATFVPPPSSVHQDGSWSYRFRAMAASGAASGGAASRVSQVLLSGHGDPGYHFTALGLAETGLCLAGKTPGCLKWPRWRWELGLDLKKWTKVSLFSFWRGEYVRALQWENLWKPNILC